MPELTYKHPQGATIVVREDGSMIATDKRGKPKKTSATPEKLAAGHGGWELVESTTAAAPAMPDAGPARPVRRPMRFEQTTADVVERAIDDPGFWMQQKVDGIRAQLVLTRDDAWVRASGGGPLKSTTAGPVARRVLDAADLSALPEGQGVVLDGEIVGQTWWFFDAVPETGEPVTRTFEDRQWDLARVLIDTVRLSLDTVRMLPTARHTVQKRALFDRVRAGGAEGVLLKRPTSGYTYDARVEHSLKFKVTHTVDAVVTARNVKADSSATLGLWRDGELVEVGSASMIGKPDAQVGEVVEVRYLYAGAGGRLVQPTVLRRRPDKAPEACDAGQLVFVNKDVLEGWS